MTTSAPVSALSGRWVGLEPSRKPQLAVLLCHGFGATGDDLVPLGHELLQRPALQGRVAFVFPEAPLSLREWGYGDARAWWHIEAQHLMGLQRRDEQTLRAMRERTPEGLPLARRLLMAFLDKVCRDTGLMLHQVVLGGFSQGAMLTTDVSLRLEEAPAGLCILSGTLICETEWRKKAPARNRMPVFQGHGRQDTILPYEGAQALRALFQETGFPLQFHDFPGGHTVHPVELELMGDFLEARLSDLASRGA